MHTVSISYLVSRAMYKVLALRLRPRSTVRARECTVNAWAFTILPVSGVHRYFQHGTRACGRIVRGPGGMNLHPADPHRTCSPNWAS